MASAIVSFCSESRSEERISREFIQLRQVQVKQAVRSLAKQGKLKAVSEGNKVLYQAVR
jgi:hypothetical protein